MTRRNKVSPHNVVSPLSTTAIAEIRVCAPFMLTRILAPDELGYSQLNRTALFSFENSAFLLIKAPGALHDRRTILDNPVHLPKRLTP